MGGDPFTFPIIEYFRRETKSYADYVNGTTTFGSSGGYSSSSYNESSSSSYGYGDNSSSYNDYGYGDPYASSSYGYGEKKEYGEDFTYGAMSVAVVTLGLVIVIEAILHRIDMSASGKPFYQAVLDAVYRECK